LGFAALIGDFVACHDHSLERVDELHEPDCQVGKQQLSPILGVSLGADLRARLDLAAELATPPTKWPKR
jgi:hypothetical protein